MTSTHLMLRAGRVGSRLILLLCSFNALADQSLIAHPAVDARALSLNTSRLIFSMQLPQWTDGVPVRVFVLPAAMTAPALAVDWGTDLQLHGFLTQGLVNTGDNRFFGDSPDGSFEFTELGVNASYRASPAVLFSGQLLSRRAGDMYDGAPVIDYALIDWNLVRGPKRA